MLDIKILYIKVFVKAGDIPAIAYARGEAPLSFGGASQEVVVESRARPKRRSRSRARLREMIEEATVDAYGESEQIGAFQQARVPPS